MFSTIEKFNFFIFHQDQWHIGNYFCQFGLRCRLFEAFNEHYIVTFEKPIYVKKALAEPNHIIGGERVTIYAAFSDSSMANIPVPVISSTEGTDNLLPHSESPSNTINKLNDDCIKKIFQYLSLRDLCAVHDVCIQFRENTRFIFERNFCDIKFQCIDRDCFDVVILRENRLHFEFLGSLNDVKSVFQKFGPLMKSIDLRPLSPIDNDQYSQDIQELIATYCSSETSLLSKLYFGKMYPVDNNSRFNMAYSRLTYLNIHELIAGNEELLIACRQLTELKIVNAIWDAVDDKKIAQMLQSNQKLKRLTLAGIEITEKIIHAIGTNLTKLEYLDIDTDDCRKSRIECIKNNLIHLRELKHLKVLNFNTDKIPLTILFDIFVNENISIEELNLSCREFDSNAAESLMNLNQIKILTIFCNQKMIENVAKAISRLNRLNYLRVTYLYESLNLNEVIAIVRASKVLKMFECRVSNVVINENEFKILAQLVKDRGNGIPLNIYIFYGLRKFNVPNHIIETYRQWIQITSFQIRVERRVPK